MHDPPRGTPAAFVSLRVTFHWSTREIDGIQCSHVVYTDGASSSYSGVCLSLDQLAREA